MFYCTGLAYVTQACCPVLVGGELVAGLDFLTLGAALLTQTGLERQREARNGLHGRRHSLPVTLLAPGSQPRRRGGVLVEAGCRQHPLTGETSLRLRSMHCHPPPFSHMPLAIAADAAFLARVEERGWQISFALRAFPARHIVEVLTLLYCPVQQYSTTQKQQLAREKLSAVGGQFFQT